MTCHFPCDFNCWWPFFLSFAIQYRFDFWSHLDHIQYVCSNSTTHSSHQTKRSRNCYLRLQQHKDTKFLLRRLLRLWFRFRFRFRFIWRNCLWKRHCVFGQRCIQLVQSKQVCDQQSRITCSMTLHSVARIQSGVQCPLVIWVPHCTCVDKNLNS